ncbi:MAG: hypothetical protein ABIQ40_18660 [Bacteroidia bacterium]
MNQNSSYQSQPTPPPYSQPANTSASTPASERTLADAIETTSSLKASGVSSAAIYEVLIKKGIDHPNAVKIIESTLPGGQASKKEGRNDMLIGGLWIAGGLILTIGSYMMVSDKGGRYFITYGPVIYGVIRFFKGVSKM